MPAVNNLQKLQLTSGFSCEYASQLNAFPVISSHGKIVANHLLDNEITDQQKFDRGVTHLQKIYDTTFDKAKKCFVLLPYGFETSTPSDAQINAYANSIASLITANAVIGDQFVEGGSVAIPTGNYHAVAKKFYERMCIVLGVAGASQNNFMGTYVTDEANFSVDFFSIIGTTARNPTHARFQAALASEAGARKHARNVNIGDGGSPQSEDAFYTSGMHQWCNSFTMMLFANESNPLDWLFYGIFEIQRKYAAKIDAKTLAYTSPWAQSVLTPVNTHTCNPGWIHQRTGGYWKVPNWHVVPFQYMLWVGFFGCLLGEGAYIWEVGLVYSQNIVNDREDPYVPARTWVNEGNAAPALLPYGEPYYPTYPETGCDALMVGVHWYHRIKDIVNASTGIAYAPYSADAVDVTVQTGDPRLFRRGFQNFGQDTILYWAQEKQGLHLACSAAGQTVFIYCNPYLPPTQKEAIISKFGGGTFDLGQLEGSILHVFIYTNN